MKLAPTDERRSVSFRFPGRARDLVDRAATHTHQDRTTFVLDAAVERANEALRELVRRKPLWEAG